MYKKHDIQHRTKVVKLATLIELVSKVSMVKM